jgi:hypothetical protein
MTRSYSILVVLGYCVVANSYAAAMRSVPPRGSGWVALAAAH